MLCLFKELYRCVFKGMKFNYKIVFKVLYDPSKENYKREEVKPEPGDYGSLPLVRNFMSLQPLVMSLNDYSPGF